MNEDLMREAVAAERREMAAVLGGLSAAEWDAATLCAGWRVREVVAHMTLPFRTSAVRTVFELVKARGDFNRMADRCARADATRLSAEELLASLRDNIHHPWAPPGGGAQGALSHEVIHGLDITVGLGLERRPPAERVALVLDGLRPRNVQFFGADLDGVELRATDLDWHYGEGAVVRGPAQDLLLVICGRRLPHGRLAGPGAGRFS